MKILKRENNPINIPVPCVFSGLLDILISIRWYIHMLGNNTKHKETKN